MNERVNTHAIQLDQVAGLHVKRELIKPRVEWCLRNDQYKKQILGKGVSSND